MKRKHLGPILFVLILAVGLVAILLMLWTLSSFTEVGNPLSLLGEPPTVTLVQPSGGTVIVSGQGLMVTTAAQSEAGLARVDFLVDSVLVQQYTPAVPGAITLDTVFPWFSSDTGVYRLSVIAYDVSGRASAEAAVEIGVQANPLMAPQGALTDQAGEGGIADQPGEGVSLDGGDEVDGQEGGVDAVPEGQVPPQGEAANQEVEDAQPPQQGAAPDANPENPADNGAQLGEPPQLPPQPDDEPPLIISFETDMRREGAELSVWLNGVAEDDLGLNRVGIYVSGPGDVHEAQMVLCGNDLRCEFQVSVPAAAGEWWFTVQAFDNTGQTSEPRLRVLEFFGEQGQPIAVAEHSWVADLFGNLNDPSGLAAQLRAVDLFDLVEGLPENVLVEEEQVPGLSGFVLDPAGAPLAGVQVTIFAEDMTREFRRTSPDGSYEFEFLAAGVYTIVPDLRNYSFTPYSISLNLDRGRENIIFTGRDERYTLSGMVLDENNQPISNLRILIGKCEPAIQRAGAAPEERCPATRPLLEAKTGVTGHWSKNDLPNGTYVVQPFNADYEFGPPYYYAEIESQDLWIDFQARSNAPEAGQLDAVSAYSISGRIKSECPSEGLGPEFAYADGLTPIGPYWQRAGADCSPGITRTSSLFGAGDVIVKLYLCNRNSRLLYDGVNFEHIDACIGDANQVRQTAIVRTDSDGHFTFEGVPPGTYEVRPISFGEPGGFAFATGRALIYYLPNAYIKIDSRDIVVNFASTLYHQWQCGYTIWTSTVEELIEVDLISECQPSVVGSLPDS